MDKWLKRKDTPGSSKDQDTVDSDISQVTSSVKKRKTVTRRYDSGYIKFGFTCIEEDNEPHPQCVICYDVLSNNCMKPSLLQRHLYTKHSSLKEKPVDYFQRRLNELRQGRKNITSFSQSNINGVEASFVASLRIAKCGKAHTIGESLILPAAKDIVRCVLGEKSAKQLDIVSLSNNTVSRRIEQMASDVKDTVILQIKSSPFFSIQFDETTDVANFAQLLVFCRFLHDTSLKEEFLFCESLPTRTTADEIFNKINTFVVSNGIEWQKCVGVCSDGARAMTGKHSGVISRIRMLAPSSVFIHCSIHRQALAAKHMPLELKKVLADAVKAVNFIKSRALNSRLFSVLCSEMGSLHDRLLLHTEVRWLSRGKVLNRLFELRCEVQIFLNEHNHDLKDNFSDEVWLTRLAYLSDLFGRLNDLNLGLQGTTVNRFSVADKIKAFVGKLCLIKSAIEANNFQHLPTLEGFLKENNLEMQQAVLTDMANHCQQLVSQFKEYFNSDQDQEKYAWIRNPFLCDKTSTELSASDQEQLIDLSCDGTLKLEFQSCDLGEFWAKRQTEFSSLAEKALRFLLPFATTYLCETGFSALLGIKNKYRSRLNVEPDLRLKLSSTSPDIKKLCQNIQCHPSHH